MHERPLVIVPPNINKFYILDLQPENSFVRHAVEQGYTVFRFPGATRCLATPTASIAPLGPTTDDAVLQALRVASDITKQPKVNALGFCVGGTMLASALALAEARGEHPVASLTLLTTLLDFHDTGVLKVFVDEAHALLRDHQFGSGGLMPGRDGHHVLVPAAQRAGLELRGGQLSQGQKPPAFDLLFWNGDSTNLPGPFFSGTSATPTENNLKVPGRAQAAGLPLDLTRLTMPAYIFGSREDHIVPWTAAYASTQLLRGPQRFVLGASGHIAGVVNPPAKKRRSYWVMERDGGPGNLPGDPNAAGADRRAAGQLVAGLERGWPAIRASRSRRASNWAMPAIGRSSRRRQVREGPGRLRPRSRLVRSR